MNKMLLLVATAVFASWNEVNAKEMVRVYQGQGDWETSSTLAWKARKRDGSLPSHTVGVYSIGNDTQNNDSVADNTLYRGDTNPILCRGLWHSTYIPGELSDPHGRECVVAFLGSVKKMTKYQVLVSENNAARLKWTPWNNFVAKPVHSLMSPDLMLVGVRDEKSSQIFTGNIGIRNSVRKANVLNRIRNVALTTGEAMILTEEEPVQYFLSNIVIDKKSETNHSKKVVLLRTVYENRNDEDALVTKLLKYETEETFYWGRPRGTISGLPTTAYTKGSFSGDDFLWGVPHVSKTENEGSQKLSIPARTSVNVTITGTRVEYESWYSGLVTAQFKDGFKKRLRVKSFHMRSLITGIQTDLSKPFPII